MGIRLSKKHYTRFLSQQHKILRPRYLPVLQDHPFKVRLPAPSPEPLPTFWGLFQDKGIEDKFKSLRLFE